MKNKTRHCEEAQPTKQSRIPLAGLLRSRCSLAMTLLIITISLSACVSRQDADEKLAKACAAAAEAFLPDGHKIHQTKQSAFADSATLGAGYREITLTVGESDMPDSSPDSDNDKDVKCVFTESYGFGGASYNAQIYQLKMDDKTWGKDGDQIMGNFDENQKLNEASEKGLAQ